MQIRLMIMLHCYFDQALLIEGLSIEDPVAFSNKICELMIELNK